MPGTQRQSAKSLQDVTCVYSTTKISPTSLHSLLIRVLKQCTSWRECVQFASVSSKAGVLSIVDRRWLQRHAGSRSISTGLCNGWTRSSPRWVHQAGPKFTLTLKVQFVFLFHSIHFKFSFFEFDTILAKVINSFLCVHSFINPTHCCCYTLSYFIHITRPIIQFATTVTSISMTQEQFLVTLKPSSFTCNSFHLSATQFCHLFELIYWLQWFGHKSDIEVDVVWRHTDRYKPVNCEQFYTCCHNRFANSAVMLQSLRALHHHIAFRC